MKQNAASDPGHVSRLFPFGADPFSERDSCTEMQTGSHKSCRPCKNGGQSSKSSPLKVNTVSRVVSQLVTL